MQCKQLQDIFSGNNILIAFTGTQEKRKKRGK